MIQKIFSIYDIKAGAYLNPFFMSSKGLAIRAFTDLVNDQTTQFNKHSEDYTLFEIGEFDDQSATIDTHKTPEPIGKAIEFINE